MKADEKVRTMKRRDAVWDPQEKATRVDCFECGERVAVPLDRWRLTNGPFWSILEP